jgi:threonyl-tRNA synthetase
MNMPERFDLAYIGSDNERHRPIMIHRTVYGSIERFFGNLIEHFAGKFPLWLAPVQLITLPINDDLIPFAKEVSSAFTAVGLRCDVDDRAESLNKKVREAQLRKIPLILTCGNKEKESGTLAVRTLDGKVHYGVDQAQLIEKVFANVRERRLELDIFD